MTEEEKKAQADALELVTKAAKAEAEKASKEYVDKSLATKDYVSKEDADKSAQELVTKAVDEAKAEMQKSVDAVSASLKAHKQTSKTQDVERPESFNELIAEAVTKAAEDIKNFKQGSPELRIEMKAVGDMSIAANFPNSGAFTQDVRNQLIVNPYERTWLSDILPQGTSTGSSVLFPKENGGEGGVAPWVNPAVDKALIDYDLTSQAAHFKWLAGHVIIDREMLDDIPFLISYLQSKMLISYKISENNFILNGTTDTNPVTGLLTAATVYNGTFTKPVDRVIDAGWGQIVEDTFEFYQPTHNILNPRSAVQLGLNKAEGSGEYDLPNGSVAFANGKLSLGGLSVVPSTSIAKTDFLTFDRSAALYITRLAPELRMFEDAALAKRNKIMFRIEGRATLAIFNNKAIVKGPLTPVAP